MKKVKVKAMWLSGESFPGQMSGVFEEQQGDQHGWRGGIKVKLAGAEATKVMGKQVIWIV